MTGPKSWWFGALPHAEVFLFVMGDWMFMLYSCSAGVQMLRSGCGCLCCTVVQQVSKCSKMGVDVYAVQLMSGCLQPC